MNHFLINVDVIENKLLLNISGEFDLYVIPECQKQIDAIDFSKIDTAEIDLKDLKFLDTAASLYLYSFQNNLTSKNIHTVLKCDNKEILDSIELIKEQKKASKAIPQAKNENILGYFGNIVYNGYFALLDFVNFLGRLFIMQLLYFKSVKNIRVKEIAFEINESAIKAVPIVALTSFLIGLVVAYQSAYQLKIYGANIFIVNMLGLSILRELSPLITAVVIAGRSGSAFTAQIGAMKITQELDAMRTMGFDPYMFLVFPRIIALIITMPILIFVSDMMAMLGGMIISNIDLDISYSLFIDRFSEVIAAKHFFVGIVKGPFFAFLIASIGIYRGLMVKDDTQSIGFNTTKSVVESIFAVIVCDAIFSIAFTNLGI
jgi:phospholipid/cholesterol/gamma-HCH transport system permease protein